MLGSDLFFRDKIPVGILGATGLVGQTFAEMIAQHPWFELTAVTASEQSAGQPYLDTGLKLLPNEDKLPCRLLFSALDHPVAKDIETRYATLGYIVVSNARSHRMDPDVPLIIPEVNASQLELLQHQMTKGKIITVPNCSTVGLTLALKPLLDRFGIKEVHIVTMQAISGAGKKGKELDIEDNIIPYIQDEEEKIETETKKILGAPQLVISAQCNRVSVSDGHTASVSVRLGREATESEVIEAWNSFTSPYSQPNLPSGPVYPVHYLTDIDAPQPKKHRNLSNGMVVTIGRLRPCSLFDYKFTLLSHNRLRGAAGGALLTAELLVKSGYVYW